jgi:hypothetical protein
VRPKHQPGDEQCAAQGTPPTSQFAPGNFRALPESARTLITSWSGRAVRELDRPGRPSSRSSEAFIYAWIAFNGWASCCFGIEEEDAELLRHVRSESRLRRVFDDLRSPEGTLAEPVRSFAAMWPVFQATEVRKTHDLAMAAYARGGRSSLIKHYLEFHPGAKREPNCHSRHPKGIEPDWFHTLPVLYRVRNNLFHGNKSAYSNIDSDVVMAAAAVLVPTVQRLISHDYE